MDKLEVGEMDKNICIMCPEFKITKHNSTLPCPCPRCKGKHYQQHPFIYRWRINAILSRFGVDSSLDRDKNVPFVVYVAETLNHRKLKIGASRRPDWRLKNLAYDHAVQCRYICYFPGWLDLEAAIHARFEDNKTTMPGKPYGKEWFWNKGRLNEFVKELRKLK
jgi:hypothetical protein